MEDATDFSWASAKAARWRGAQCVGQIPVASTKLEGLMPKSTPLASKIGFKKIRMAKKPWYCKLYQVGQCQFHRDLEHAGKVHKHICSFCLSQGRISAHPEKECQNAKL